MAAGCFTVVLLGACGGGDATTGPTTVSRDTFIEVIVALRAAATEAGSAENYSTERERILREHGVTDSALVDFVRVHGADPRRMALIWDTIAGRLRPPEDEIEIH
jgi:hypothetical protein